MNKKIVCLVLTLAMILTASLALAVGGTYVGQHEGKEHDFDYWDKSQVPTGGNYKVLVYGSCDTTGRMGWYCTEYLAAGGTADELYSLDPESRDDEYDETITLAFGIDDDLLKMFKSENLILPTATTLPASITLEQARTLYNNHSTDWNKFNPSMTYTDKDGILRTWGKNSETGTWWSAMTCDEARPQTITFYCQDSWYSDHAVFDDDDCRWEYYKNLNIWGCYEKECKGHTVKVVVPHDPSARDLFQDPDQKFQCDQAESIENYCTKCGKVLGAMDLGTFAHVWGPEYVYDEGNCVTLKTMAHKCTRCGFVETYPGKEYNTTLHAWGEWQVHPLQKPTCTKDGEEYRVCYRCNTQQTRVAEKLGHKKADTDPLCIDVAVYCEHEGCEYSKGGALDTKENQLSPAKRGNGWYLPADPTKHPQANLIPMPNFYVSPTCQEYGYYAWHCTLCCDHAGTDKTCIVESMAAKDRTKDAIYKTENDEPNELLIVKQKIDKVDHVWSDKPILTKAPTCTEKGEGYLYCVWYNYTGNTTNSIEPLEGRTASAAAGDIKKQYINNHCTADIGATNPGPDYLTGTTAGMNHFMWLETACKKVEVPALGHHVEKWTINNEPNEGSRGYAIGYCDQCGKYVNANFDTKADLCAEGKHVPFDPDEDTFFEAKAPTCTEAGYDESYVCSYCGTILNVATAEPQKILPALGHEFDTMNLAVLKTPEKAATCTEPGNKAIIKCARCDALNLTEEEAIVPALGHDFTVVKKEAKAATCTEEGSKKVMKCSRCDAQDITDEEAVIAKLPHDIEVTTAGKPATCTEAGLTDAGKCKVCGEEIAAKEIPALGHTTTKVEEKPATCTEDGTKAYELCSVCGKKLVDGKEVADADLVIKAAHTLTAVAVVEGNCGKAGVKAHDHCSVCGKNFIEGKEVTDADLVIAATGEHKYEVTTEAKAATCTEAGYTKATKCTVCGDVTDADVVPALGHDWVEVEAVAATNLKKGSTAGKKCSRCDATEGVETIDYLKGMFEGEDGKFYYYANGAVDTTFTGVADFEGGKFLIEKGVWNNTFTGVSNAAYETEGVFYYFDHGQAQLQYSGLATYDGQSFILKDGKVRLDYEGTYSYDGGIFWVSVGRICTELNGVHPESDGVYYYVAGQRNPATGIVPYMGSTFYFESGKMVTMTGEYKDFNGNAWSIVNGQAYPLF